MGSSSLASSRPVKVPILLSILYTSLLEDSPSFTAFSKSLWYAATSSDYMGSIGSNTCFLKSTYPSGDVQSEDAEDRFHEISSKRTIHIIDAVGYH